MNNDENGINEREKTYALDEIPTELTRRLWVSYGIGKYNAGKIEFHDFAYGGFKDHELVPLCEHTVTIRIPKTDGNTVKAKAVSALEEQKKDIHAEYHQQLKEVQDKIDNLLALEYKPEQAA